MRVQETTGYGYTRRLPPDFPFWAGSREAPVGREAAMLFVEGPLFAGAAQLASAMGAQPNEKATREKVARAAVALIPDDAADSPIPFLVCHWPDPCCIFTICFPSAQGNNPREHSIERRS